MRNNIGIISARIGRNPAYKEFKFYLGCDNKWCDCCKGEQWQCGARNDEHGRLYFPDAVDYGSLDFCDIMEHIYITEEKDLIACPVITETPEFDCNNCNMATMLLSSLYVPVYSLGSYSGFPNSRL